MNKVLGLDIGANSVGWALLDEESNEIIDLGSRVFPAGVNSFDTAKEQSKMADRRVARLARRRFWRRKRRLRKLRYIFSENNISHLTVQQFNAIEPYSIRKKALDEKISLDELARIIYHLAKRRGYFDISSAAEGEEAAKEKGKIFEGVREKGEIVMTGINDLKKELIENGGKFRTIGEYFASLNTDEIRIRARYTERQMFIDEFNMIWEKQAEYKPSILTDDLKEVISKAAYWQRPLKIQKFLVGKCKFEQNHKRAAKSHPIAQLFRLYQVVNNLTISGGDRIMSEEQELTQNERERLINKLLISRDIELKAGNKALAQIIKIDKHPFYVTNFDQLKKIDGVKTYWKIFGAIKGKTIFSHKFDDLTEYTLQEKIKINDELKKDFHRDEITIEELLQAIWRIVFTEKRMDIRINNIKRKFELDDDIANKLANIGLEPGYASLSVRAMRKMLPFLRNGRKYHEAALDAGYRHSLDEQEVEKMDFLPTPAFIRNPIVTTALFEVRKVVNEIIERYGKPDVVRVEMARDLKKTKDERDDIKRQNDKNRQANDDAVKRIIEHYGDSKFHEKDFPRANFILKYKLWKEQKERCIYSGDQISIYQLFSAETDVDHILPYSRTLDDSYMNKVVCFRSENAEKTNKTPWEAFSGNKSKYAGILDRIKDFPNFSKAKRFKMNDEDFKLYIGEEGFISRQLNDTRYISREAVNYLKHICDKVNVGNGSTTAYLRRLWGLNSILGKGGENIKNREDHRHHAIDAVVIALTTSSSLQTLSTYTRITGDIGFEGIDDDRGLERFPFPWEHFRNDVEEKAKNIIVSHKVNKRARGQLHDESYYGLRKNPDGFERRDEKGLRLFHIRKNLDANLTHSQIHAIVELNIKDAIIDRLYAFDIDPNSKYKLPPDFFNKPLIIQGRSGNTFIPKSVRIAVPSSTMRNIRGYNLWVETGSNHHIIIYKDVNTGKQNGKVVTLFDAVQRKKNKLPIVDTELGTNEEFMYSLMKNEIVYIGQLPGNIDLKNKNHYKFLYEHIYRVQIIIQDLRMVFRKHNVSVLISKDKTGKDYEPGIYRKNAPILNATKLKITPLGFLEIADD
ncbi:MAG: cas9 [Ignavibacteria bacterium]|nr:cas9 [Ignavibacteria bacterium]